MDSNLDPNHEFDRPVWVILISKLLLFLALAAAPLLVLGILVYYTAGPR